MMTNDQYRALLNRLHEQTGTNLARIDRVLRALTAEDLTALRNQLPFTACTAWVAHGPGHQSKTRCRLVEPHDIHEAVYGGFQQFIQWRSPHVSTGFFDEPRELEE